MSILGKIFDKIFHRANAAQPIGTQTPSAPQPQGTGTPAATMDRVDVEQMKLVGMESSLAERKELADELGYTGDKNDSAAMNIWLHKQVMKKLQDNGGKVPADLLD